MILISFASRSTHLASSSEPSGAFLMVDEKARDHEEARHPEYNKDDVGRFEPEIEHCNGIRHDGGFPDLSLADKSQQLFDMFNGRIGQNAMAQIEDMGPVGKSRQDRVDRVGQIRPTGNQRQRIQIALHG